MPTSRAVAATAGREAAGWSRKSGGGADSSAIPDGAPVRLRAIAREAAVAVLVTTAAAVLLSPADVGLGTLEPHPVWVAVLVMSARYGTTGLLVGVATAWSLVAGTAFILQVDLDRLVRPLSSGAELGALAAAVLVGWVASLHERRREELVRETVGLSRREREREALVREMTEAAASLRERTERLETSLTFLSDVAARLERGDPVASAQAALELAMARSGARFGVLHLVDGARLRMLAWRGAWGADTPTPPELVGDRTAAAAYSRRRATQARSVDGVGPHDSDLAAPAVAADGTVTGILALRGLPPAALTPAVLNEVAVVARWWARAVEDREVRGLPASSETVVARPVLALPSLSERHVVDVAFDPGTEPDTDAALEELVEVAPLVRRTLSPAS